MAKVSIAVLEKAPVHSPHDGFAGSASTQALFEKDKDPIHVHVHRIDPRSTFRIGPMDNDCVAYVWSGDFSYDGRTLATASSLIAEREAAAEIVAGDQGAVLITFHGARHPAAARAGGHVHLLPSDRVPRKTDLGEAASVGGAMFADATCETCEVWLHENSFPPSAPDAPPVDVERGIHSHAEDEVIFVTSGQIRLGARLFDAGTAIAIAANTKYAFTAGQGGMSFINFRAARPSEIEFKGGYRMDEVAYWNGHLGTPEYITLAAG